ncbi:MAG: hypothetical protein IKE94_06395 [Aeriscardovia sp.]|nr:hypothetical protein [Aeriscardovia sp.]
MSGNQNSRYNDRCCDTRLGVMLCGSLLIPIASDIMDDLTEAGESTWASMVGVVVLVSLVSLVVVALYSYSEK